MLKTYDYWFFFNKDNDELYAYTDDKKFYKDFKSQRNMKLFYYKKKELTRNEVRDLTNNENEKFLTEYNLKYDNEMSKGSMRMVITKTEKLTVMNVSADLLSCDIYKYAWITPYIFKDDIIKSLQKIGYISCNNLINSSGENYFDIFSEADELGIFLRYFGNTL